MNSHGPPHWHHECRIASSVGSTIGFVNHYLGIGAAGGRLGFVAVT
ncbi:hypothetical protein HZC00_05260 [Candidatus Kaiserbacteria bacterium]|nr:hypothetical protein [Candidatus Kaiserbacteria bacterium]